MVRWFENIRMIEWLRRAKSWKITDKTQYVSNLMKFDSTLAGTDKSMKDEFQRNREESNTSARNQREELTKSLDSFKEGFDNNTKRLNDLLKERFETFSKQQRGEHRCGA